MRPALHPDFLTRPLAHRAFHDLTAGRPENSRAAVSAAIAAGYAIEIDLQLSADGRAIVFHDYSLARLAEAEGPLRSRSAAELAAIGLRGGAEGIPDFRTILDLVAGRVPLLVEIKDQDGAMGPSIGALEAAALADLARYRGPVALMSFNPHSVAEIGRLRPDLPRGLVTSAYRPEDWHPLTPETCNRLRDMPDVERIGASFISHEWRDLARPRVAEVQAAGLDLLCWTIRSGEEEAEARQIARNVTFEKYLAEIPAGAGA